MDYGELPPDLRHWYDGLGDGTDSIEAYVDDALLTSSDVKEFCDTAKYDIMGLIDEAHATKYELESVDEHNALSFTDDCKYRCFTIDSYVQSMFDESFGDPPVMSSTNASEFVSDVGSFLDDFIRECEYAYDVFDHYDDDPPVATDIDADELMFSATAMNVNYLLVGAFGGFVGGLVLCSIIGYYMTKASECEKNGNNQNC